MTVELLTELAKVKAMFQQRAILSAMGVMQRDLVEPELEQCELARWHEYCAHGGKLDFTGWQEMENEDL